jgi:hypothetical protein
VRMPERGVIQGAVAVWTSGVDTLRSAEVVGTMGDRAAPAQRRAVNGVPRQTANSGVWIEFDGERWFSTGPAVSFNPDPVRAGGQLSQFRRVPGHNGRSCRHHLRHRCPQRSHRPVLAPVNDSACHVLSGFSDG